MTDTLRVLTADELELACWNAYQRGSTARIEAHGGRSVLYVNGRAVAEAVTA